MILGVDAFNLAADKRGMGRLVRQALRGLETLGESELRLIVRAPCDAAALTAEFSIPAIAARDLSRARLDAVWYPWNGMRFDPHAPSVVTVNDPFAFTFPHSNFIARRREQAPIRRAIRQADLLFTISEWGARELERIFGVSRDRIRVALPSIEPFWHAVEPPKADPYMLFVAGPDERKNAAFLFRTYAAAFAGGPPNLVVAGTLRERDEASLAQAGIRYTRARPSDEELRALYSGALAVLVPSLAEGYGLPAIEAMACGAPVLASNSTALPEASDGAALLLAPDDAGAWRDALVRVASDESLRDDLRAKGLARVERIDPLRTARLLLESVRRLRASAR